MYNRSPVILSLLTETFKITIFVLKTKNYSDDPVPVFSVLAKFI